MAGARCVHPRAPRSSAQPATPHNRQLRGPSAGFWEDARLGIVRSRSSEVRLPGYRIPCLLLPPTPAAGRLVHLQPNRRARSSHRRRLRAPPSSRRRPRPPRHRRRAQLRTSKRCRRPTSQQPRSGKDRPDPRLTGRRPRPRSRSRAKMSRPVEKQDFRQRAPSPPQRRGSVPVTHAEHDLPQIQTLEELAEQARDPPHREIGAGAHRTRDGLQAVARARPGTRPS